MNELQPRHIRTITARIVTPDDGWTDVTGWDAPWLMGMSNPSRDGILRIFSGDEPDESEAMLTDRRIEDMKNDGRCREWHFSFGYWSHAEFGPVRP